MDLMPEEQIPFIVVKTKLLVTDRELRRIYNSIVKGNNYDEFVDWLLDNEIVKYQLDVHFHNPNL